MQLEGTKTSSEDRILIIGATNRPQELDEAIFIFEYILIFWIGIGS